MKRIVVVGGGISGAAAAWTAATEARRHRLDAEVILLERERAVGGKALSVVEDGWLFETGPLGYLDDVPELTQLVEQVGLENQVVTAGSVQQRRFVYLDGRVRNVPAHPAKFLVSGVLKPRALIRLACEPWIRSKANDDDESVWDFAARRLGSELAERLIHPMALGVFAGNAKRLSLPSAFPLMAELEKAHGSLVRAQIARARARRAGTLPPRRSTLCSFRGGLQTLPRTLSDRGRFITRTSSMVETVRRAPGGAWLVAIEGDSEPLPADALILAGDGRCTASILREESPGIASVLDAIAQPPVYVVGLGYPAEARSSIPEGFGVLIPRGAAYRALGVTCDGYLFPRDNDRRLLVRVLFGGTFEPDIATLEPDAVIRVAEQEMARLFRLTVEPVFKRARLWRSAIPQYELGHRERRADIEQRVAALPGLHLAGNALYGTSFGKTAARGVACGKKAVASFSQSTQANTSIAPDERKNRLQTSDTI